MHCFAVEETLSSGFVLDVHVIVCLAWLKKTSRDVENRDQRHVEDLQAWFDIKDPKTSLTQKKWSHFLHNILRRTIWWSSRLVVSIVSKFNLWESGSRKSKNSKMAQNNNKTKSMFRPLKLKSHEEYLIYKTYFVK